ncbi:ABC transporter substrate-binding protein [Arsenicicoccus dermatophilus]|uniref:ABC transporter substrate-binding protein n=1 Tax=Arsenicicoccus dermatophilus TaxID=1076331 RepID=UPI0039171270
MIRRPIALVGTGVLVLAVAACGSPPGGSGAGGTSSGSTVSVTNCGHSEPFPSPARRVFVNDGNMIAMALAVGAKDQLVSVTSLQKDSTVLAKVYGDQARQLPDSGADYPTLEGVLAKRPDVMVAGYNYGYSESRNLMPDLLRSKGIAPYILSESCRQKAGEKARGTMDPWVALRTDLTNLGAITGHAAQAKQVTDDLDARLVALRAAPQATRKPVVLLFDSAKDAVFTSGSYGGPQGVIDAAGATNVAGAIHDTWTNISWEKVATAKPDFIAFVHYGQQTMADKVALLEANPATRDLPAVKEKRYLNLPYAAWTSSPLNIDAAENLRKALEKASLLPASQITPRHDLREVG